MVLLLPIIYKQWSDRCKSRIHRRSRVQRGRPLGRKVVSSIRSARHEFPSAASFRWQRKCSPHIFSTIWVEWSHYNECCWWQTFVRSLPKTQSVIYRSLHSKTWRCPAKQNGAEIKWLKADKPHADAYLQVKTQNRCTLPLHFCIKCTHRVNTTHHYRYDEYNRGKSMDSELEICIKDIVANRIGCDSKPLMKNDVKPLIWCHFWWCAKPINPRNPFDSQSETCTT